MEIDYIKKWCSHRDVEYYDIPSESVESIYNLLISKVSDAPKNAVELLYHGMYAMFSGDDTDTIKYLSEALNKGNFRAATMMGVYYSKLRNQESNMMKYFRIGLDGGDPPAMNAIGVYHLKHKDYIQAEKMLQQSANVGCDTALLNLGILYEIKGDIKQMKKYCITAANHEVTEAMGKLGKYYLDKKKYKKAEIYILMGIACEDAACIYFYSLFDLNIEKLNEPKVR